MSLDVMLYDNKVQDAIEKIDNVLNWLNKLQIPTEGCTSKMMRLDKVKNMLLTLEPQELYRSNITHNLNKMAMEAGIYEHLWRPDEIGINRANQLIEPLRTGFTLLESDPERFKSFDSPNGWGLYEHFVPFVRDYLQACIKWPDAVVEVSR